MRPILLHSRPTLCALVVTALLALPSVASAQNRTLWLAEPGPEQSATRAMLREFLRAASDQHVVGAEGIARSLESRPVRIPGCLDGTAACENPLEDIVEWLGVRQVVTVNVVEAGEAANATCTVSDPGRTHRRVIEASSETARQSVLACVGRITESAGTLRANSEPAGATVLLDGERVGTTPWEGQAGIGMHALRIELEGYHDNDRVLEVTPGAPAVVEVQLERSMARFTLVSGTPNAVARIDGVEVARAGAETLVEPGTRTVVVEAPGYEAVEREIEFRADERINITATLALSNEEFSRREMARTLARPLMLQGGISLGRLRSDWNDATFGNFTPDADVACTVRPTTGECQRTPVTTLGINLEAIYGWRFLEIEPLGLGYQFVSMADRGTDYRLEASTTRLSHVRAHRWTLRIGHIGARHLINEYWEPYGRVGFTARFNRGVAENIRADSARYRYTRTDAVFELRGGTRFHVNTLVYGYGELNVALTLNHGGTGPEISLAGGVGVNLPSPFSRRADEENRRSSDVSTDIPPPLALPGPSDEEANQ